MIFLLSPAKKLDYESRLASDVPATQPQFVDEALELIEVLRQKSPQEIARLMKLSDKLAALNVARYEAFAPEFSAANARQAILAFHGDVYQGLDAASLSLEDLLWAQEHVRVLSGLYGLLRPLDWMQPYRLEMGTRLAHGRNKNLYEFWGRKIAAVLNDQLQSAPEPVVVNLASQEYFKSVDLKALKARVIECVFEDEKAGQYKIISFYAKRARGLMTRFAVQNRIDKPEGLQAFDLGGYAFFAPASEVDRLVFRRPESQRE